jgi:hypothetical protein
MRTTVDIPDTTYAELKARAAREGRSVKELILIGVQTVLQPERTPRRKKYKLPVIESKQPGRLNLTNEMINELLFP